ncbi:hypothetical protein B7463_g6465, partial [Scytalidium lignicola]
MPSSFASAAAGQAASRDPRTTRGDGRTSGDWSRRDTRTTNGTLTLRRSSTAPYGQQSSQGDSVLPAQNSDIQGSSQQPTNTMYEQSTETRYSKDQLLDIFRSNQGSETANGDVSRLFTSTWDPGHSNGANGRGWGKTNDSRETHGPEVCWDQNGTVQPIGLEEMSALEKSIFSGDVNSPLKPPPLNTKDQNASGSGVNGRKTSVSQGQGGSSFGLTSPSSRPGTRRRETSDSLYSAGLASPSGTGRFSKDDTSPFFNRKLNETKEGLDDREGDNKRDIGFGGLMRSNTGNIPSNGPASPWSSGPVNPTITPMGNFGSFSLNPTTPVEKRPGFGSLRGESRLAHLMPKENSEDTSSKATERSWRSRPRTDTDPFAEDSAPPGGTIPAKTQGIDTPVRGSNSMTDFGMTDLPGFREAQRNQNQHTPARHGENEPLSPMDTNPYRSPHDDRTETDDSSFDGEAHQHSRLQGLGGVPEHPRDAFAGLPRSLSGAPFEGSDRSQTSSAGGSRAFPGMSGLPSLGGLGGLGGWPTSGNTAGTPDREHRAGFPGPFGSSLFGPMGDLQSPSLGGLGGMFGPGGVPNLPGSGTVGRGSKLGSLFPAAMQAQMQGSENETSTDSGDVRHSGGFGTIGRNFPPRETGSPIRAGRSAFEEMFQQGETARNQAPFSTSDSNPAQTASSFPKPSSGQGSTSAESSSNQLPAAQQRVMVMPDRMRWVYLDPQGQVQGPWSGLEMHDWYKASFFTPDLSVKKLEDGEFEPLGQLIRRIGNSREPFLVPQIGIPHGPPTTQPGAPFSGNPGAAQPGAVQPPFAGAFPSFGTTLTAEQQNNLERRKQEEQYLMARQREFLAQQQVNMKQLQMGALPASLNHHSSAHSLQSQPSFGSMTSPIGMPPQAPIPPVAGFFDSHSRQALAPGPGPIPPDFFREEEFARLSLQDRQQLFGPGAPAVPGHAANQSQQLAAMLSQQQTEQRETVRLEQLNRDDPQAFKARLREFEQLRAQHDAEEATAAQAAGPASAEPIAPPPQANQQVQAEPKETQTTQVTVVKEKEKDLEREKEVLSLTQQVQKAASAKQSQTAAAQPESPWAKINTSLPMPFPPPPQSTTPLPAPTAQRRGPHLPDTFNESRSRSETPEVAAPPPLAPWAKESVEMPKGPSLKEIQEAEAKKAAKAEEAAAAARRIIQEQELKLLTTQPMSPVPGLPTSSTWASGNTPTTPSGATSAWAKPNAIKAQTAANNIAAAKKTLADIQREEELRKQKLAAATAAATSSAGISTGKRYADLASKTTPPSVPGGSAWSTVGAGGKVKVPTGPAAVAPTATVRAVSGTAVPVTTAARVARPAQTPRSSTSSQSAANAAHEEFMKWAKGSLVKGLNSNINVDDFVLMLSTFPPEASIIADSIYSNSQLMDGRRFAEEYLRRRKLSEKGIVEPANTGSSTTFAAAASDKSGGWSEVAKKNPPKEEPAAGFKVVPNKKKGKK